MSKIQLLLTDVDGTLVEFGKNEISPAVIQAIKACEADGIKVSAVTGRPIEMMQPLLEVLGFTDPCIFDNGATIADPVSGDIIWQQVMDIPTVKQVATTLLPGAAIIDYAPVMEEHAPADNEADLIALIDRPTPSIFAMLQIDMVEQICNRLDEINAIKYYTDMSTRGHAGGGLTGIQVSPLNASKFHGVEQLRQMNGIAKEATAAIGDQDNDLPLFANAGLRFAMGNGSDGLKAAADHIVADVTHDGFVEAAEIIRNFV